MSTHRTKTTLSKGRFVSACECATKLYYKCHYKEYQDTGDENDFMKALAEGGFQVGELAKLYYPGGVDHSDILDPAQSWREFKTAVDSAKPGETLLFYEPTILVGALLVRADVLKYCDGRFHLIEVKSKSFSAEDETIMKQRGKGIRAGWMPYIEDITFQALVIERAFPGTTVFAELLVADKDSQATIDGLNQLFKLTYDPRTGRAGCVPRPGIQSAQLGAKILTLVDVTEARNYLLTEHRYPGDRGFAAWVDYLEALVKNDQRAKPTLDSDCKSCEFRPKPSELKPGMKSGFNQCWREVTGMSDQDLENKRLILEVWNWRGSTRDHKIAAGTYLIEDLEGDDVVSQAEMGLREDGEAPDPQVRLTDSMRREVQVEKVKNNDPTPFINVPALKGAIDDLKWPLHLIDFETARVAIPFHRGQRPYGQIAFQFSHHLMHKSGHIEHQSQFINANPGQFPNFEFVRALRKALGDTGGSVFMFHHHEKTVLNDIHSQLSESDEPDRQELMDWIRTLANPSKKKSSGHIEVEDEDDSGLPAPPRALIDLRKWVLKWWYHPATRGSNSIKAVLPVVFDEGGRFEALYSKPVYGGGGPIKSLNYLDEARVWIKRDPVTGKVADPYKSLPRIFGSGDPLEDLGHPDRLFHFAEINQGGAAMQAYARMQFTEMTPEERKAMQEALLRYCELDTFAMGILIEYFRERVGD